MAKKEIDLMSLNLKDLDSIVKTCKSTKDIYTEITHLTSVENQGLFLSIALSIFRRAKDQGWASSLAKGTNPPCTYLNRLAKSEMHTSLPISQEMTVMFGTDLFYHVSKELYFNPHLGTNKYRKTIAKEWMNQHTSQLPENIEEESMQRIIEIARKQIIEDKKKLFCNLLLRCLNDTLDQKGEFKLYHVANNQIYINLHSFALHDSKCSLSRCTGKLNTIRRIIQGSSEY